ncbi:hypothetical protein J6590_049090 [Homalodisca vitripennis]|nr:hypothetical protein J6590_049090 [Homalodisca vitripennis]
MNVSGERCNFKAHRPRKRTNPTLMQQLGKTNNSWLYRQKLRVLRERVRRALQLQSTSSEKANQPNTDATARSVKQTIAGYTDKSFGFSANVSGERCNFKAHHPRKRTNPTLMQQLG